jgi:2-dehydro-3-deoxygluconokinase
MAELSIRPASASRFDAVSLGEVMLRLDPGAGRIRSARTLRLGGRRGVQRG